MKNDVFTSGMTRDSNEGKPRYDLIFPKLLPKEETVFHQWAEVMAEGAKRHSDRNWEKAHTEEDLNRFKESAFRHFMDWYFETNVHDKNAAKLFFNVQGAEYVKWRLEK